MTGLTQDSGMETDELTSEIHQLQILMKDEEMKMQKYKVKSRGVPENKFSGGFLQTAQTWANAGVVFFLELVSPIQVTHLPPVWDLLLPLA